MLRLLLLSLMFLSGIVHARVSFSEEPLNRGLPWKQHTIDSSSRGADGIRVADVNGDGLMDLTTGWEEGGQVRVYLNPGQQKAKLAWPAVTVGRVRSPEDAVFVDLDRDGAVDVVSCCEGNVRTMFVHWAPKEKSRYLDSKAWKTEPIPASVKARMWMFCLPMQVDGINGIDLVAGSKGNNAEVGWFEAPAQPRDLSAWKWHPVYKAGWIMSLFARDIDGDGDLDVLTTDRKGKHRGCWWLENPGSRDAQKGFWKSHLVGGAGREVMFMAKGDLDGDGLLDIVSAVKDGDILSMRRIRNRLPKWKSQPIRLPSNTGSGKGVQIADLDLDGRMDIALTCEHSHNKSGVLWFFRGALKSVNDSGWVPHEISGVRAGIKFDLIELLDLDGDGDLDLITCEERDNLGVIWYENPTKP